MRKRSLILLRSLELAHDCPPSAKLAISAIRHSSHYTRGSRQKMPVMSLYHCYLGAGSVHCYGTEADPSEAVNVGLVIDFVETKMFGVSLLFGEICPFVGIIS